VLEAVERSRVAFDSDGFGPRHEFAAAIRAELRLALNHSAAFRASHPK